MLQSFVVVACLQVTVAKATVNVRQQLHLVAHIVFAPLVQLFQNLLGLLQTVLVMPVGLRCNTTVGSSMSKGELTHTRKQPDSGLPDRVGTFQRSRERNYNKLITNHKYLVDHYNSLNT